MGLLRRGEGGQAVVEFALIFLALMMLTVGLVDVGRAFYEYNEMSSAARFGARWASVVGGVCILPGQNTTDWCTQQGTATGGFWAQPGNMALQGNNVPCPAYSPGSASYYSASDPDNDSDNDYSSTGGSDGDAASSSTTIVGSIDQHFDTSSSSPGFVQGAFGGLNLANLKVCIQTTAQPSLPPARGDYVTVVLHYHFDPISIILARTSFDLNAMSQYEIQG